MIEYANDSVIKLLKQYDMLAKSLNYISDVTQKNDICNQMTKIIREVLDITNSIYEKKYKKAVVRSVYLMEDEKNRLLELINLINERKAYITNQVTSNEELTGIAVEIEPVLGEEKLEEYKDNVKKIDRYKNNVQQEIILKDEIKSLDKTIRNAAEKISNNKNVNKQLEERMIRIVTSALEKLSLYNLKEKEKEIELAYTELGYSLEKAKENAKIARKECSEEIILECDNILASTTLDYERYKEKKLILKLMSIYKNTTSTYEELLAKREEINNILMNISGSQIYALIGNELNKQYSTIKLENQDIATLKSLAEERDLKIQKLKETREENSSESIQGLLSTLLENERKHQEKLEEEKKRKEQERIEREKIEEQKKLEELARRQKELEKERNKEIERRTKQLLDEKKKPILSSQNKREELKENVKRERIELGSKKEQELRTTPKKSSSQLYQPIKRNDILEAKRQEMSKGSSIYKQNPNIIQKKDDFFSKEIKNKKVVNQGIPVIKNGNVQTAMKASNRTQEESKIFPDIPMNKKENIFPNITRKEVNDSFFNENEFDNLSDYNESNKKNSWF